MPQKLIERFKEAIDDQHFTVFEIAGFKDKPDLALLAGMAIGYKMAIEDAEKGKLRT